MKTRKEKKVKQFKLNKMPLTADTAVAPASKTDTAVGRAELENLTTATLYKLLKLKNVPLRSKLRKKEDRIEALRGVVSAGDLANVCVKPGDIVVASTPHPLAGTRDAARDLIRPGNGKRLDVPVAGIDVHSKYLWVAIATCAGVIWRGIFDNTRVAIADMIRKLKHHGVAHVAMESTAEYWLKACWALEEAGFHVLVANAKQVAATQGNKTDRLDARRLALAFRDGRLKPSILCTPEQFQMRKLNREAIKKAQHASSAITRAKRIMGHYDAPGWLENVTGGIRARRILVRALLPGARGHLLRIVTDEYAKYSGKITDPAILAGMARELGDFLGRITDDSASINLKSHLEDFVHYQSGATEKRNALLAMIKKNEKMLETLRLIVTLPCVSLVTALAFLVEIVDIRFFWRGDSLVKWCGMAPRVNQSGVKKRKTGRIYKGGNKWMRSAAYNAASIDFRHSKHPGHPVGRFVARLYREKKKPFKKAVIAGGAKLLRYLYHVLALEKPFQEVYADMECEKLRENRDRKQRMLSKEIRNAELPVLLMQVSNRLKKSTLRLDAALVEQIELLESMMLKRAIAISMMLKRAIAINSG
jgi:transposase